MLADLERLGLTPVDTDGRSVAELADVLTGTG
jgi:hypothetical protein